MEEDAAAGGESGRSPRRALRRPARRGGGRGPLGGARLVFALAALLVGTFALQLADDRVTEALALHGERAREEPWTLLTSSLVHSGAEHLLDNLFPFILFGYILERMLGSARFAAVCLAAALGSSAAGLYAYPEGEVLGASGVVSGIVGALAAVRPSLVVYWGVPMPVVLLGGIWMALDIAGVHGHADAIAYEGHLGGLAAGAAIGLLWRRRARPFGGGDGEDVGPPPELDEGEVEDWEDRFMRE